MDPTGIRRLATAMAVQLGDAWHTCETATALSVADRDRLLDVAAWGGDEDEAFTKALGMLDELCADDPPGERVWRTHVWRSPDELVAVQLYGTHHVAELRAPRDQLDGNLDVVKAADLRRQLDERTATRLRALLSR